MRSIILPAPMETGFGVTAEDSAEERDRIRDWTDPRTCLEVAAKRKIPLNRKLKL
jgi:hypothetical protein